MAKNKQNNKQRQQQPSEKQNNTTVRVIKESNNFIKDLELVKSQSGFKADVLKLVLDKLAKGEQLDPKYRMHKAAVQSFKEIRGCIIVHIQPNVCLVVRMTETELYLVRIGSHNRLGLTT